MQLTTELGRVANVFLKDGSEIFFKPMEYDDGRKVITGTDEFSFRRSIRIYDIEGVLYFRKMKWR